MEDWDLQAVVRGCSTGDQAFASIMNNPQQPSLFSHPSVIDQEDDLILSDFPMVFEPRSSTCDFDGLEGLFKPFYPGFHQVALSPQSIISSTTTVSVPSTDQLKLENIPKNKQHISETSGVTSASCSDISHAIKWKRRKNDQKRVVKQVTADGLSSDMWAWRKYGQKPIKGSPYPRSYYRCSSLKGCLARKQVERSSSDPSIFIVTYTSEHSHAHPPRRNALAGSTRAKSKNSNDNKLPITPSNDVSSPTTPSLASINTNEDDLAQNNVTNRIEDEEILEAAQENNHHFMQDFMFSDDELYPSLEDLDGLLFN